MPCAKCQQDKPTPVTYSGRAYCLSCGLNVLEEAHERELAVAQIQLDLKAANDELRDVDQQIVKAKSDEQQLLAEKAEIDKKVELAAHAILSLDDARNAVSNRIDKLTAQLAEQSKGCPDVGADAQ